MIVVAVQYHIRPGHIDEALEFFQRLSEESRKESGVLMYQVHRHPSEPSHFFIYEQYADQAAFDAHRTTPHFQRYATRGLWKIVERRIPEIYAPLEELHTGA